MGQDRKGGGANRQVDLEGVRLQASLVHEAADTEEARGHLHALNEDLIFKADEIPFGTDLEARHELEHGICTGQKREIGVTIQLFLQNKKKKSNVWSGLDEDRSTC